MLVSISKSYTIFNNTKFCQNKCRHIVKKQDFREKQHQYLLFHICHFETISENNNVRWKKDLSTSTSQKKEKKICGTQIIMLNGLRDTI